MASFDLTNVQIIIIAAIVLLFLMIVYMYEKFIRYRVQHTSPGMDSPDPPSQWTCKPPHGIVATRRRARQVEMA